MERCNEIWDYLIINGIATNEKLKLITSINGYFEDVLNDVIYARIGYRTFEQLKAESEV